MSNILEIKNLSVHFGGIKAVDGISMDIPEGKIITLIGANGAGKSTILRSVSGIVKPQGGEILFGGESLIGKTPDAIVNRGITLVPEGRRVFPKLDNDIEYIYSLFPRLKERYWQLAGTLSGGEQQMLAVGRALMSKPRLIMMDEPSLGLAPLVVKDIFEIIKTINKSGITVLLNEQNANMALKIADLGYVIETGRITLTGTGTELLSNELVKEAYLGKSK